MIECGGEDRELRARGERIAAATGGLFVRVGEGDAGVGRREHVGLQRSVTDVLDEIAGTLRSAI